MKRYFTVEEISTEIGISRRKLSDHIKKLGLDTKKLTEKEKQILIDDCKDVLLGKKDQKTILDTNIDIEKMKTLEISNLNGASYEQRLAITKQEFDFVVKSMAKLRKELIETDFVVKSSNGNTSQNAKVKTYNEFVKSFNSLQKTINEIEQQLKLTSTSIERAIDD